MKKFSLLSTVLTTIFLIGKMAYAGTTIFTEEMSETSDTVRIQGLVNHLNTINRWPNEWQIILENESLKAEFTKQALSILADKKYLFLDSKSPLSYVLKKCFQDDGSPVKHIEWTRTRTSFLPAISPLTSAK